MNKNYKLIGKIKVSEKNSLIHEYEHIKSGGRVSFIHNKQKRNILKIVFKTPAEDDTGKAHIIEHCVLEGSEKYPFKDGISFLRNNTLCNSINADTSKARTSFYCDSFIKKDIDTVLDYFLDTLFNPLFIKDERVFMQEGIRIELDKNEKRSFNGIVFNEMSAKEVDEDYFDNKIINSHLYPNSFKQYISGGYSKDIVKLKYEDVVKYYKKHYVPSNCMILISGNDIDENKYLKCIDETCFSKYKRKPLIKVDIKKDVFGENIKVIKPSVKDNHRLFIIYKLNPKDYHEKVLMNLIFSNYLSGENDYFFKDLVRKYGTDISAGTDFYNKHGDFTVLLETPNKNLIKSFKDDFINNLKDKIKTLSREQLDDTIYRRIKLKEYSNLNQESDNSLIGDIVSKFYTGKEDYSTINYFKELIKVKDEDKLEDIKNILEKKIINGKYSTFYFVPSKKEKEKKEKRDIQYFNKVINSVPLKEIIDKSNKFKGFNFKYYKKDYVEPKIELDYMNIEPNNFDVNSETCKVNGITIVKHNVNFKNYVRVNLSFDLKWLSSKELQYLAFLNSILPRIGTDKHDPNYISFILGKYSFSFNTYMNSDVKKDKTLLGSKGFYFRCEIKNIKDIYSILKEIMYETKLDEKIIKSLLKTTVDNYNDYVNIRPDMFQSSYSLRGISLTSKFNYLTSGIGYVKFLNELYANFDIDKFKNIINNIIKKVYNSNNLTLYVIGNKSCIDKVVNNIGLLNLNNEKYKAINDISLDKNENRCYETKNKVNYNVMYFKVPENIYKYDGTICLLDRMLDKYLEKNVRFINGAYGSYSCSFIKSNITYIYSIRDPNIKKTFDCYFSALDYVINNENEESFKTHKPSLVISFIDDLSIENKCEYFDDAFKKGYTYKEVVKINNDIFNKVKTCNLEDVKNTAKLIYPYFKKANITCFGDKKGFDKYITVNK